jgi:hypothetical protein
MKKIVLVFLLAPVITLNGGINFTWPPGKGYKIRTPGRAQ